MQPATRGPTAPLLLYRDAQMYRGTSLWARGAKPSKYYIRRAAPRPPTPAGWRHTRGRSSARQPSGLIQAQRVMTMSSILRIIRTVSVAILMALVETRSGCTTFSA